MISRSETVLSAANQLCSACNTMDTPDSWLDVCRPGGVSDAMIGHAKGNGQAEVLAGSTCALDSQIESARSLQYLTFDLCEDRMPRQHGISASNQDDFLLICAE